MTHFIDHQTVEGMLKYNALTEPPTIQALAAVTTNLTLTSAKAQIFTGVVAGQFLRLPDATTLAIGHRFDVYNQSPTQFMEIENNIGGNLLELLFTSAAQVILQDNSTAAGVWIIRAQQTGTASGLINYYITANAAFATTSATDVMITGFTITPVQGTYVVLANINGSCSTGNAVTQAAVYRNGTVVATTQRTAKPGSSGTAFFTALQGVIQFDGSQSCSIFVNTSAGTYTVTDRSLVLLRIGT